MCNRAEHQKRHEPRTAGVGLVVNSLVHDQNSRDLGNLLNTFAYAKGMPTPFAQVKHQ